MTEAEVKDIKNRRNLPEYVLFDDYSDKITYRQFQTIYRDDEWKHIKPTVEPYPYNLEFSCQFTASPLDYGDIVEMRKMYSEGITLKKSI